MDYAKLRPRQFYVFVEMDPQMKGSEGGIIFAEEDYIKMCARCGSFAEQLNDPCIPRPIEELDPIHDRYVIRGYDTSHEIETTRQTIVPDGVVKATVLRSAHPSFKNGMRVLVLFSAGESIPPDDDLSPIRAIHGDNILAEVEEE